MSIEIFIPVLVAVLSLTLKSVWDIYNANRTRKIELLQRQLSLFYYPILIRLEKDNVTWEMILDKRQEEESLNKSIGENIEENITLPNHREIASIIENQIHLCQDEAIVADAIRFIKHVSVYFAIRASGDEVTFPENYDQKLKWPSSFYPNVSKRTRAIQQKLDKLIGM